MSKKVYLILIIIFIVALSLFIFVWSGEWSKKLEIDFLDVGQGDAELIKTPFNQNILIDGGPDNTILRRLGENLSWYDRTIDLMILTHPHEDHVAGLIEVLKRYKVKKILYTGVVYEAPVYQSWLELVKSKNIETVIIDRPQAIQLGEDCSLEIIWPSQPLAGLGAAELNDTSIVAKLRYKQNSFLFMGDLQIDKEQELIKNNIDLQANVLKVGHHGSDTASSEEFLEKVKPQIAIIEVGQKNDFGLPSLRVIKKLERIGATIHRTDQTGTVKMTSDGINIVIL